MSRRAGKPDSDGLVRLAIRVPPELALEFDALRGRNSQAEAGTDAVTLWVALDRDSRAILADSHPLDEKRQYAEELVVRLRRPSPAEVVDAVEAHQRGRKRKPRRNSA